MFKELIVCIIIIVTVIAFNIFTQNYTKESVQHIDKELAELRQRIINEEYEELEKLSQRVLTNWQERKSKLEYYIEHDELEKVETEITSMIGNIKVGEYEQSVPDIDKAIFILNHINEKFSLKIQNIF